MPSVDPAAITTALLRHFDRHRRSMPWRETDDPYAIWVSEVMLQQTRVETVIPYYERWLERFPTVEALADAELGAVLKEWEGLGYYSRARNLHRAARVVRERHGGRIPDDPAGLRDLPGVGEYTTGAVASIAFGVPLPAVDGNVRRVLSRLYDLEEPGAAALRRRAAALVPDDRPGDFNQALMELGATVCTPRAPACDDCPLADPCLARRRGVQELRPRPRARKRVPEEVVPTTVLLRGGRAHGPGAPGPEVLLVRRPETGLLGGMWEFPGETVEAVSELVARSERLAALPAVRHTFSHKRVEYRPEVRRLEAGEDASAVDGDRIAWLDPAGTDALALPVAQQKVARLLLEWLDREPAAPA